MKMKEFEKRLETLIEVHLPKYLPLTKKENKVAQQLAMAVQNNLTEKEGKKVVPHAYTLVAHPDLVAEWKNNSELIESFKQMLQDSADEANLDFTAPLSFSLATDSELNDDEIKILISQEMNDIADTKGMNTQKKEGTENIPNNAFLIIHGTKVFPLQKSVVDIGRRMENTLTIDDPRVSRNHAQLRAVDGHFVIFDLNSTGGTYVNSQRSHQSVLYPGDVISLAGVPLIYGQDNPPHRSDLRETTPFNNNSASANRETAVLHSTGRLDNKKD